MHQIAYFSSSLNEVSSPVLLSNKTRKSCEVRVDGQVIKVQTCNYPMQWRTPYQPNQLLYARVELIKVIPYLFLFFSETMCCNIATVCNIHFSVGMCTKLFFYRVVSLMRKCATCLNCTPLSNATQVCEMVPRLPGLKGCWGGGGGSLWYSSFLAFPHTKN